MNRKCSINNQKEKILQLDHTCNCSTHVRQNIIFMYLKTNTYAGADGISGRTTCHPESPATDVKFKYCRMKQVGWTTRT